MSCEDRCEAVISSSSCLFNQRQSPADLWVNLHSSGPSSTHTTAPPSECKCRADCGAMRVSGGRRIAVMWGRRRHVLKKVAETCPKSWYSEIQQSSSSSSSSSWLDVWRSAQVSSSFLLLFCGCKLSSSASIKLWRNSTQKRIDLIGSATLMLVLQTQRGRLCFLSLDNLRPRDGPWTEPMLL